MDEKYENNVHILVFSNRQEGNYRYTKIMTGIQALQNTLRYPLTVGECRQGWGESLEGCFDAADIILPLISLNFVGDPDYPQEIEIVLKKHRQGKVRVIPVLLSAVKWEESHLGELTPLPKNRVPISKWSSVDEAVDAVADSLRQVILEIFKDRGYLAESDEDDPKTNDKPISSTAFNRTGSILPFSYLNFSGKDQDTGASRQPFLRMIMRTFHEHHSVSPRSLSEQDVYERVQQKSSTDYSLQECQRDLKYLASHFNLVRMDDMSSMAHSITAFDALLHNKFYEATPDGLDIEKLIDEKMQANKGRLSKGELRDVKRYLVELDAYLEKADLRQGDLDDMADKWQSVYERWDGVVKNSRAYFSSLERSAQHGQYDFNKFVEYKNTVIDYVQSFADTLMDVSHEINELLAGWSEKKDLLIGAIAQSVYRKHPDLEHRPSLEAIVESIRYQVVGLETWFKTMAHVICERAASEIHRIVNRATSLALYQRSHVNNVTALRELAVEFMQITDFESAQQVFDAAFAHVLPLHMTEGLAGHAQMHERPEETLPVWDEPPPARLSLGVVKRKNTSSSNGGRKIDDPVYEDIQECYALQERERRKELERQERFNRLFAQHVLNLDSLPSIDPLDRAILEEVIDGCLNHPAKRYQGETGSTILLLNPSEQVYMHLCSSDGLLFLPCYQLRLQDLSKKSAV